jgi:hypothetical protein
LNIIIESMVDIRNRAIIGSELVSRSAATDHIECFRVQVHVVVVVVVTNILWLMSIIMAAINMMGSVDGFPLPAAQCDSSTGRCTIKNAFRTWPDRVDCQA